ncbi:MAG: PIG-L family deacetylase [Candidatus Aenigmatarchaeota archaeon]|nr:MAG: PIG-L family deacetylase [Candidatus Aenigmarchaeota archaeon]
MKILLLSPHTDDVELGAGGMVVKLLEQKHEFKWVVFSICEDAVPPRMPKNTLKKEFLKSCNLLGIKDYKIFNFKNKLFQEDRQKILDNLVIIKNEFKPDLVICPSFSDIHQDHRIIAEECFRCFKKDAAILGYEFPWNCRNFSGNYFSKLEKRHLEKKMEILKCYDSQIKLERNYFSKEFIFGLAKVRGVQCNSEYAEAFEVIRWMD